MIDHVALAVRDYAVSRAFYTQALAPLGYRLLLEPGERAGGFGSHFPDFWVAESPAPGGPTHVALTSADRETVDLFHAAALAAGGRDNGGPGLRPHYHEHYYAAYALDPDGNNIEAVCHRPV